MLEMLLITMESGEDKKRFAALYEEHHAWAERVALRITGSQSDAEDAVQNAFLQVIRHFEKIYEIPCDKLGFWIISIVKNEALMIVRRRRREVVLEEDIPAPEADGVSDRQALAHLFASLPELYRSVLELKFLAGYSGKEVAKRLGISETAVNTRVSRGRALLREAAEKEGFEV